MGSDSEDDDEKDNIYSQLEVRQDRKTDKETDIKVAPFENVEPCGYCTKVCFCSPGHRIKRPYNIQLCPVVFLSLKCKINIKWLSDCHFKKDGVFCEEASPHIEWKS